MDRIYNMRKNMIELEDIFKKNIQEVSINDKFLIFDIKIIKNNMK